MNSRRKFVIALGAGALAAPFAAFAQQQGKVWRIGVLSEGKQSGVAGLDSFKIGMRELGYVEDRDYVLEYRFAALDATRLPALAAELVALKLDLILTTGSPSAVAAHDATREVPVLIFGASDPVGSGLAASLRHPGGNVTGLSGSLDSYPKRLDLLRQLVPGIRRVAHVYDANFGLTKRQYETECRKLRWDCLRVPVSKPEEFAKAFDQLKREKVQGIVVSYTHLFIESRNSIIELAAKHRMPAIYGISYFPDSGGLISYGANSANMLKRSAVYADKIFKGAKPGDLPIEQPSSYELVINLKTAKALGLKIPQTVLVLATRVIE